MIKILILIMSCALLIMPVLAQRNGYTVTGRVVDENGHPRSNARVRLSYIRDGMSEATALSESDGKFSLTREIKKGAVLYLYVEALSKFSTYALTLSQPPYSNISTNNTRFYGKPIKFADQRILELGDVPVQFWYGNANLKIKINDRNLTKNEWQSPWCRLRDETGKVLAEQTVAGYIIKGDEIDLPASTLKLSLPAGKWRLDFKKYNDDTNKVGQAILGQTQYFVVRQNNLPITVNVNIKCQNCLG